MEHKTQGHPVLYECDEGWHLIVEEDRPIKDYITYRLTRALETLVDVEILAQNQSWNSATNRLYYACFYAVSALLLKNNVNTKSHSGTRTKFSELFVQTKIISINLGRTYTYLFDNRLKGDYSDFFKMDEEKFNKLLAPSKELIKEIEKLLKE
jgi:uncharacterized protein (UPF0332 family)